MSQGRFHTTARYTLTREWWVRSPLLAVGEDLLLRQWPGRLWLRARCSLEDVLGAAACHHAGVAKGPQGRQWMPLPKIVCTPMIRYLLSTPPKRLNVACCHSLKVS
jgi:hypothetical protein